ncbi:MAG TPA: hypothetical protein VMS77_06300 [Conexivisphaerales archaeon]|nr:hypothetical protein [Conexivisphaerales archaeon]
MVPNIDPVYFLGPGLSVILSVSLVLYWAFRRRFQGSVLLYSLAAYGGAIALKYAIQIPTVGPFIKAFGVASVQTGLYYGLQTVFLEVGLAYLVARYAVGRGKLTGDDAEAYGIGLAFWENGVFLGILSLLSLSLDYLILAGGSSTVSQQVYQQLVAVEPQLFEPPAQALPTVLFSVLERISSAMAHFAWGYLVLLSAYYRKTWPLLIALPMGLLDALVPFAGDFSLAAFEGMIFALSLAFLLISLVAGRKLRTTALVAGTERT